MTINPLAENLRNLISPNQVVAFDTNRPLDTGDIGQGRIAGGFESIFTESLTTAGLADAVDKVSSLGLLTGRTDDLSGLMLDIQKAELSLNLALQVRNKVIDAYNEILRMSV